MPGRLHGHRVLAWRAMTNKELADKILLDAGSTDRELALAERLVEEIEVNLDIRAKLRGLRQRLRKKEQGYDQRDSSDAG